MFGIEVSFCAYLKLHMKDGSYCCEEGVTTHMARVGRYGCEQCFDDLELNAWIRKAPTCRNHVHNLVNEQPLASVINTRKSFQISPCCAEGQNKTSTGRSTSRRIEKTATRTCWISRIVTQHYIDRKLVHRSKQQHLIGLLTERPAAVAWGRLTD